MAKRITDQRTVTLIVMLLVGIALGLSITLIMKQNEVAKEEVVKPLLQRVRGGASIDTAVTKVAKSVGPAVVSISTERTEKVRVNPFAYRREGSPFQDQFFDRFFREFFRGMPNELEKKQAGLGSGVVIDEAGFILTNEHVISGADKIIVAFPDGRKFEAKTKGSDARRDLAVIQVDAKNLPVAPLGDSNQVRTGEWVVAIGNPFGYIVDSPEPTVTAGVVSALHRSLPSKKSGYLDLIQTDAAINPGNSGGPLCDLDGNVIGINVAIFSTSGGYQGLGFAIPINMAKGVIEDLKKGRKIAYGWMGVVIQDVNEDLAKYFGLPNTDGVLISEVVEGSPAEEGGLKEGDVIIELDGQKLKGTKELVVNVSRMAIGKKIKVVVVRDKREEAFTVKIGKMPTEEEMAHLGRGRKAPDKSQVAEKWRGLEVYPITDELVRRFNITNRNGVIVVNVDQGSPAFYAALRQGDIIKRIGRRIIKTMDDYKDITAKIKGDVLVYTDRGFTIVKE